MTRKPVEYSLQDRIATIRIDDGKRNAFSPQVLKAIYRALDKAESDRATVIITGREEVFSAGFDLNVMKRGGIAARALLQDGAHHLGARALRQQAQLLEVFLRSLAASRPESEAHEERSLTVVVILRCPYGRPPPC